MDLSSVENELYLNLKMHAEEEGLVLNPDSEILEKVIKGMVKIKEKKGEFYCPCRLVTGNKEIDDKIICPCEYHKKEIEEHGHCHCYLFFRK